MKTNIVLIGMRGTGKTTMGKVLAQKCEMRFIDADAVLEKAAGKNIAEIVSEYGWPAFREMETAVIARLSRLSGVVLATGGGVILRSENVDALREKGTIILLTAPIRDLAFRLQKSRASKNQRPSLTGKSIAEELTEVWAERRTLYFRAADFSFFVPSRMNGKWMNTRDHAKRLLEEIKKRTEI